jgi:glycerol-3-phosphate acyltransferase PlsY
VILVAWKRYVSLGSTIGAVTIAGFATVTVDSGSAGRPGALAAVVIATLVVLRHLPNIKRLLLGDEPRIGEKVTQL